MTWMSALYLARWLAQGPGPEDYLGLAQYGVLGALVIALLTGLLVPKWAHDAVVKQVVTLTEKNDRQAAFVESMAGQLGKALDILEKESAKRGGRAR